MTMRTHNFLGVPNNPLQSHALVGGAHIHSWVLSAGESVVRNLFGLDHRLLRENLPRSKASIE